MGLLNQWETILKSSTGPPTNQGRWAPNSPLQSFTAPGREAARINSGDGMGWPESNPKKSEVCLMIVFSETHGNMKLGSFQISKWKNLTHHHGEATLRFGTLPWKEVPWKELPWNHLALDNGFFFWIPLHATHHNKWFFLSAALWIIRFQTLPMLLHSSVTAPCNSSNIVKPQEWKYCCIRYIFAV